MHRDLVRNAAVSVVTPESIQQRIYVIRGERVMLDADLANLYGVETRVLVQAVSRNLVRFPDDFRFQLDDAEFEALRSQNVISNDGRGGRRYRPHVFTEHGIAMLSGVLRSERAIAVNIEIMRAFVSLRKALQDREALARKLDELEARFEGRLAEHDEQLARVFAALRQLVTPTSQEKRPIGFGAPPD